MSAILVINGPNLNLLGTREPGHYGTQTLADIQAGLAVQVQAAGHTLRFVQSNAEHELIEAVHSARRDGVAFIIINPAAFTHYSYALRDAVAQRTAPLVEVHLTNPAAREAFRHESVVSGVASGTIAGFGLASYLLALQALSREP